MRTVRRIAVVVGAALLAIAGTSIAQPASAAVAPVTKVLAFVEENHSLSQMRAGMPYLYAQATRYGLASQWTATRHPSLPNYLAMAAGSTFGVTDDLGPAYHLANTPSVFGSAIGAGRTAKSYQESMPSNCYTGNAGGYAVKHNAWAYFGYERANCLRYDVPSGTTGAGALRSDIVNGTLPNVGQVTPNLNNDGHDGSLAAADAWLKGWLTLIYASPDWKAGRLVVVVTADEDDHNQGNTVLTAVLHPTLWHKTVSTPLNHYTLTRLYTRVGHAACLRSSCLAPSMVPAFGLTLG